MRRSLLRAAAICVLAALALAACDSADPGDPDPDPPAGDVTGVWAGLLGPGIVARYDLTDASGVVGGRVFLTDGSTPSDPHPVSGTHAGSRVEFDHLVPNGGSEASFHFALTLTPDGSQLTGTRALSNGGGSESELYLARQSTRPGPAAQ